jgi:hypothetical protein
MKPQRQFMQTELIDITTIAEDPTARERLTVPIIPFSEFERRGAGMYRGKPRAGSADGGTSANQTEGGGSIPTPALTKGAD